MKYTSSDRQLYLLSNIVQLVDCLSACLNSGFNICCACANHTMRMISPVISVEAGENAKVDSSSSISRDPGNTFRWSRI
jgi:hypothetical protein